jgi:hypothetical protein
MAELNSILMDENNKETIDDLVKLYKITPLIKIILENYIVFL